MHGKPVVLIGERHWLDVGAGDGDRITEEQKSQWIDTTRKKFDQEPDVPAIDALIERDVKVENLSDVERRLAVLSRAICIVLLTRSRLWSPHGDCMPRKPAATRFGTLCDIDTWVTR